MHDITKDLAYNLHLLESLLEDDVSFKDNKIPMLTLLDMKKLPYLTKYPLAQGIWGWRIPNDLNDNALIVVCEFCKNSILAVHEHDCWEKIAIIKGEACATVDEETFIYDEGSLIVPPFTSHTLKFIRDSRAIIEFTEYERK